MAHEHRLPGPRSEGARRAVPHPPQLRFEAEREEQLLAEALFERDEAAFELVLDRLFSAMLRTAMIYVRSRAHAEEVVQETWLAVLGGIQRFEARSSLKTWIFRILINRAKTHAAREARVIPLSSLSAAEAPSGGTPYPADPWGTLGVDVEPIFDQAPRAGHDPASDLLARELGRHIDAAIAELPAAQREVLVLRDVNGWSAAEVCNMLGISESNQRVLLHRARVRVRERLAPYLAEPEADAHERAVGV
jgi:RNA polymerase sigma-70 factor (ECF subfamily)